MSHYCYAHAVIGNHISVESLYRVTEHRSCAHPLPDGAAFCPICGKPAYRMERRPIFDEGTNTLGGLYVVFDTDNEYVVVGPVRVSTDGDKEPQGKKLPDDLRPLREQTRAVLEPLGLWDEQQFGLWAVICVSY